MGVRYFKLFFVSLVFVLTINSSFASDSERVQMAKKIVNQAQLRDTDYGCKPKSWFSEFSANTRMAITGSLVVFYEADGEDHSFKKLYHMFRRDSETRGKIMGSGYPPLLGISVGSFVLEEFGMRCCELTVILGKPKKTEFNCGWDTMIN